MKKIIFIIVLFLSFISVKAESFYEDNWISGVYATYEKGDYTKSQLMRFIRRKGDDRYAYCLTPDEFLYEDSHYQAHTSNQAKSLNITEEKWERLMLIAYYGYGYSNHTSNNWYAVTQFMLWKEIDSGAKIYWTDSFKGNEIIRFTNEIKEIETLIKNHKILPNISDLDIPKDKEIEIYDSNKVLDNYQIIDENNLIVKKDNNKITINAKEDGNYKIKFLKKDGKYAHVPIAYTTSNGQDVLITGRYIDITKEINIKVTSGDLEITKVDSKTNSIKPQGESELIGAKYNLYDENNDLVETMTIGDESKAHIKNLKYGNYSLKEVEAPIGYELDNKTYNLTINNENTSLILKEEVIEAEIVINKFKNNNGNLEKENNIYFSFYDSDNNLIKKEKTDENGMLKIILPYGEYTVKQENTPLGYKRVEEFKIKIDNNKKQEFNLINNKISATLRIIKKDEETNKNIILSNTYFKIKDLENNEYILDNKIFKTNDEGILNIPITGGKYLIEEIKAPYGYLKGNNYEFILDENTKLENNILEIVIYNKKIKGQIKILKKGNMQNDKVLLLENVEFKIYAYEDIKTSDGTIYYKKDELIDTLITDKNGTSIISDLPLGKYYIKEIKTNDNFILDNKIYIVELTEKENNINMTMINKEKSNFKYPRTSNTDIYINSIITYLIFMIFILLIQKLKHEK